MSRSNTTSVQLSGSHLQYLLIRDIYTILSSCKIDSDTLKKLQQEIEDISKKKQEGYDHTIMKLYVYDILQRIFSDDGRGSGHLIPREAQSFYEKTGRIRSQQNSSLSEFFSKLLKPPTGKPNPVYSETPDFLRLAINGPDKRQYTKMAEKIFLYHNKWKNQTPWMRHIKGIDFHKELISEVNDFKILKDIWIVETFFNLDFYNQQAEEDALLTILAILRFKADKGNFPDNLDELITAGYLKEQPQDPYNNRPLTYKRTGNNFTLYSLGPNFKDDGGKQTGDKRLPGWWNSVGDTVFWPVSKKEAKKE